MKKILAVTAMLATTVMLHAQGYIDFTGTSAAISTNTALGTLWGGTGSGGTSGKTGTQTAMPGAYYYVLLYSSSPIVGNSAPTNSMWAPVTFFGGSTILYGTNSILAGGMSGSGGSSGAQINLASTSTYYVELVGWSSSLGTDWATVSAELASGTFQSAGFLGFTSVGSLTPGTTPGGAGDPTVFTSMFPNGSLVLYAVPVPEPTTIALAGLGGVALLAFRRRKA